MRTRHQAIVSSWPSAIKFETYTKSEVERISVKEISQTNLFDDDRNGDVRTAELGGLYDPAMGPMERGERCITCHQTELHCPGHCGHINLATPCLNPVFYNVLRQLITGTCVDCSHFLCAEKTVLVLRSKLLCLNAGRIDLYNDIEKETKDNYGVEKDSVSESMIGTKAKSLDELSNFVQSKLEDLEEPEEIKMNRSIVQLRRQTIDNFIEIITKKKRKKCPKCGRQQEEMKFEAQGETKVYIEVSKKDTESIDLENDEDEDDAISETTEQGTKKAESNLADQKCLQRVPNRLLLRRIKRLFQVEKSAMNLLFNGSGCELFFIEHLLVPPNCFRRMNRAGRKVISSDRTSQLGAVLEASQKLKWLQGYRAEKMKLDPDEGYESSTSDIKDRKRICSFIVQGKNPHKGTYKNLHAKMCGVLQALEFFKKFFTLLSSVF